MAEDHLPWLNEAFLIQVLQGEISTNKLKIIKYSAVPAVAAGNNFLSHLYRVPVDYKEGEEERFKPLIVKVPIETGVVVESAKTTELFTREPKVYKDLLPIMEQKINYKFGPDSFYCSLKNGLVLKDMKADGYVMCDRLKQLNYQHCEKVIINIAKFHAASVACYHDNPNLILSLGKDHFYSENSPSEEDKSKNWTNTAIKHVLEIIENIEECKQAANFLRKQADFVSQRKNKVKMFKPKTNGLNVLNHGDLWVGNILFKHDKSGNIVDLKFIDYQMGRYASPILDVIYFIWTSANEVVRDTRVEKLFGTYRKVLNENLENLGCEERLTEDDMGEDIKALINYGFIILVIYLPIMMCDPENVIDFEQVSTKDFKDNATERFGKIFKGKHYTALVPNWMKQFYNWVSVYI